MAELKRAWILCFAIVALLCFLGVFGEEVEGDALNIPTQSSVDASEDEVLDLSEITSPDDVPQIADWKDRCRKEVGDQAVDDIETSQDQLMSCVNNIISWEKLQHEINRSIPRGELDLVFKKYCGRRERLMVCVEDLFTKLDVCLNERERQDLNVTRAAIDAGLDFVCHNDGDRIALFMGEKGEECVKSQKDNIRKCVEDKVPEVKDAEEDPLKIGLDKLTINEENCKKVTAMHKCVVEWTEECEDSTPANILDSLITQMLKVTPCKETEETQLHLSSAHDLLPCMLTLFGAALTAANILL